MCALWGLQFSGQVPGRDPLTCILAEPRDDTCRQLPAKLLIGLVGTRPAPQREEGRLACSCCFGESWCGPSWSLTCGALLGRKAAPRKCVLPFPLSRPSWQPRPLGRRPCRSGPNPSSLSAAQRLRAAQVPGLLLTHFQGSEDAVQLLGLPFLGGVCCPGGRGPGLLLLLVSWAWRAVGHSRASAVALPPS